MKCEYFVQFWLLYLGPTTGGAVPPLFLSSLIWNMVNWHVRSFSLDQNHIWQPAAMAVSQMVCAAHLRVQSLPRSPVLPVFAPMEVTYHIFSS